MFVTHTQTHRQTHRHTNRQTDRQTHTHTHTDTQTHTQLVKGLGTQENRKLKIMRNMASRYVVTFSGFL